MNYKEQIRKMASIRANCNDDLILSKTAGTISKLEMYKRLMTGEALRDADKALASGARKLKSSNAKLNKATRGYYGSKRYFNLAKESIPNAKLNREFIKDDYNKMLQSARHSNRINSATNTLAGLRNKVKAQTIGARVGTGAGLAGIGAMGHKIVSDSKKK